MNELEFIKAAEDFLHELFLDLDRNSISIEARWEIDHLCYRADSEDSYQNLKQDFSDLGEMLIESVINGRLISTFKLKNPIVFKQWQIELVELPAPKVGKITSLGFEHIEVVCDVGFSELQKKYGHLNLDLKGLNKELNPDLEICLGDRNIKFHHKSLSSIIQQEKRG